MQIVIARYNENLEWLNDLTDTVNIVYNKGDGEFGIKLPNIGREAHTFLYHIVNNYDCLEDSICFLQGNPFDHFKEVKEQLRSFNNDFTALGGMLTCSPSGLPHHSLPALPGFIQKLNLQVPKELVFVAGAQFIIKKSLILKHSLAFYNMALDETLKDPMGPYMMERLWYYIFKGE